MERKYEFAGQNTFDSRDVEERINELEPTAERLLELTGLIENMAADPEHDPDSLRELEDDRDDLDQDEIEEYNELVEFRRSVDSTEWKYGVYFINENYFEEYAHQEAEDLGLISSETQWPATCIDWEQATRELQQDYSSVEFDGDTYYYR